VAVQVIEKAIQIPPALLIPLVEPLQLRPPDYSIFSVLSHVVSWKCKMKSGFKSETLPCIAPSGIRTDSLAPCHGSGTFRHISTACVICDTTPPSIRTHVVGIIKREVRRKTKGSHLHPFESSSMRFATRLQSKERLFSLILRAGARPGIIAKDMRKKNSSRAVRKFMDDLLTYPFPRVLGFISTKTGQTRFSSTEAISETHLK
jgi:hypothetical protein